MIPGYVVRLGLLQGVDHISVCLVKVSGKVLGTETIGGNSSTHSFAGNAVSQSITVIVNRAKAACVKCVTRQGTCRENDTVKDLISFVIIDRRKLAAITLLGKYTKCKQVAIHSLAHQSIFGNFTMTLDSLTQELSAFLSGNRAVTKGLRKSSSLRCSRTNGFSTAMLESGSTSRFVCGRGVATKTFMRELEAHLHKAISTYIEVFQGLLVEGFRFKSSNLKFGNSTIKGCTSLLNLFCEFTIDIKLESEGNTNTCRSCSCTGIGAGTTSNDRGDSACDLGTRCHSGGILVNLIEVAEYGHTITPCVLKVHASLAISSDDELEALVKPAVTSIAMKHDSSNVLVRFWLGIIKADCKDRRVNGLKRCLVGRILLHKITSVSP
mmetsp:Transcript_17132/g.33562  ORF Transcript_17132/g.33562 Transcript_17132/m.33562 type:complete len:381 (+) Transcript_17132:84-1226(+)